VTSPDTGDKVELLLKLKSYSAKWYEKYRYYVNDVNFFNVCGVFKSCIV